MSIIALLQSHSFLIVSSQWVSFSIDSYNLFSFRVYSTIFPILDYSLFSSPKRLLLRRKDIASVFILNFPFLLQMLVKPICQCLYHAIQSGTGGLVLLFAIVSPHQADDHIREEFNQVFLSYNKISLIWFKQNPMLLQVSQHFYYDLIEAMQVCGLEQASLGLERVLLTFASQRSRIATILQDKFFLFLNLAPEVRMLGLDLQPMHRSSDSTSLWLILRVQFVQMFKRGALLPYPSRNLLGKRARAQQRIKINIFLLSRLEIVLASTAQNQSFVVVGKFAQNAHFFDYVINYTEFQRKII